MRIRNDFLLIRILQIGSVRIRILVRIRNFDKKLKSPNFSKNINSLINIENQTKI